MTALTTSVGIVGAGPGGLQLSACLKEMRIDHLLFERGDGAGNFFNAMPRKRRLISLNKVHVGDVPSETRLRWDWNSLISDKTRRFSEYDKDYHPNADSLVRYFRDFAANHDLGIVTDCAIEKVEKQITGGFMLTAADCRVFHCETVVIATGLFKPYVPEIEGIDLAWQYRDIPNDPQAFTNKRILIIGKGNSAFESADWLLPYASNIHMVSPEPDRMAAMTHFVGDTRSVNYSFYDTAFFKQQNALLNATINSIHKVDGVLEVDLTYSENEERAVIRYDEAICCTGFRFDDSVFTQTCKPDIDDSTGLPRLSANWESSNIDNLYFAGTLMQGNDFQKSSTPFIKGIRHNSCSLANLIGERVAGVDWPCEAIRPDGLHDHILKRIHTSASLWHLWNSLCDVFILDKLTDAVRHLRDVPQSLVFEDGKYAGQSFITLRFGHHYPKGAISAACGENPFVFIHPIFNLLGKDGEMIAEAHFDEDIEAKWEDPAIWAQPLRELLDTAFADMGWLADYEYAAA
jgi:thioredoxin reductase